MTTVATVEIQTDAHQNRTPKSGANPLEHTELKQKMMQSQKTTVINVTK
jgi:hypothetical protein